MTRDAYWFDAVWDIAIVIFQSFALSNLCSFIYQVVYQ